MEHGEQVECGDGGEVEREECKSLCSKLFIYLVLEVVLLWCVKFLLSGPDWEMGELLAVLLVILVMVPSGRGTSPPVSALVVAMLSVLTGAMAETEPATVVV